MFRMIDSKLPSLIIFFSSILLVIWPIPETIFLRNAILFIGFVTSLMYLYKSRNNLIKLSAWPIFLFLVFFLWLGIHLCFFSSQFDLQLSELKSTWLRCLLATPLGFSLGLVLIKYNANTTKKFKSTSLFFEVNIPYIIIFLSLSSTCLIYTFFYFYSFFFQFDAPSFSLAPYNAKTPIVVACALFLPLCFITILNSLKHLQAKLIFFSIFGLLVSFFSIYFSNTKNGFFIYCLCSIFFICQLIMHTKWGFIKISLSGVILCSVILFGTYASQQHIFQNPMWTTLSTDIKIGLDIDRYEHWKNRYEYPIPKSPDGVEVSSASYERIAWFRAGVALLVENPLGFGLLHHSFGWLALRKWPNFYKPIGNLRGATHSGWLDLALGTGFPGVLLILIPLFAAWVRSLHNKGLWFSYTSWSIPTMTCAYLIAEVAGAHFTELLFFMTAFFCGITLNHPTPQCNLSRNKNNISSINHLNIT